MKRGKQKKIFTFFSVIIIIYIISMSIGYAFFSETLNINGIASTEVLYEGDVLPVAKIILDTKNNRYYSQEGSKSGINFYSEEWNDDNTYTLEIHKGFLTSRGQSSIKYTIAVTNDTTQVFKNGTVSTDIIENTGNQLQSATTTITKTELQPGETVYITMTFDINITWRYNTETAKATITYDLMGKPRYIYFIVTYTT